MTRILLLAGLLVLLSSFQLPAAEKPAEPKAPAEKPADPKPAVAKATAADDTAEANDKKTLDPAHLKSMAEALGAKPGVTTGPVHTFTLPRTDLDVRNLDMGDIPVEAGLASTIRVFRCGCGKYYIIGEFCTTDYESNDVIDALRKGQYPIASVAPMLFQESPRIVLIRFQGEGHVDDVVKIFKETVRWIGENRTKHNPIPKD